MPTVNQRKILVISEDAVFATQLSARWQSERVVPSFTIVGSERGVSMGPDSFDLAVLDVPHVEAQRAARRALELTGKPLILVCSNSEITLAARRESPRALTITCTQEWPDVVVLLALEVLRRVEAIHRADRAEQVSALLKCHATLGQYVIEMRHSLNNALTSVLGNSELMLLEPGAFSAGVRSQIDTIRNMALRMHEILQRFSSLEKELTFVEQQEVKEQTRKPQVAAVGR